mgnify:CR=1 FL=1
MINIKDILETINMIREECLDIRTITMGISLYDCAADGVDTVCDRIYDKITKTAEKLVSTGVDIEKEYGIPIINKRVSVTPISMLGGKHSSDDYVKLAKTLDRAAETLGINFIGGFGALVHKGMTKADDTLLSVIPEALAETKTVTGCYCGDLLSWVMGKAPSDALWATIMSNVNIVAVSTLADPACIVLSEGVAPDDDTLVRAKEQGINILTTSLDTFDACVRIASAL